MPIISHSVHIKAPKSLVWQTMIDVENWPDVMPQFKKIVKNEDGPLALDSTARITPAGFWSATWTVTDFEPEHLFTWDAGLLPGVHLSARHAVETVDGGISLTLELTSSGPLATVLSPVFGIIFRRNLRQEGDGMKGFCEERHDAK